MSVVDAFTVLLSGLEAWRKRGAETAEARQRRLAAIDAVRQAALLTKAYLHDSERSGQIDRGREVQLSEHWQQAASKIADYDAQLFQIAQMKALGWADPNEWSNPSIDPAKLKLQLILEQCDWLRVH